MFYYVYILQSETDHNRFYTGFTEDLDCHAGELVSRAKAYLNVLRNDEG